MSSAGPERPVEWERLELSIRRLLDDNDRVRQRARQADRRIHELETALHQIAGGGLDPMALSAQVDTLRAENRELLGRIERARERVSRLMARLRFLEEER